jgi:hypothetical protein
MLIVALLEPTPSVGRSKTPTTQDAWTMYERGETRRV